MDKSDSAQPLDSDIVYLISQQKVEMDEELEAIVGFSIIRKPKPDEYHLLIHYKKFNGEHVFELQTLSPTSLVFNFVFNLPEFMVIEKKKRDGEVGFRPISFKVKSNGDFTVISNSEGYIWSARYDGTSYFYNNSKYVPYLYKEFCQPLLKEQMRDEDMFILKTSCFNNTPIFDIVGDWLVYSPTKQEFQHMKAVVDCNGKPQVPKRDELLGDSLEGYDEEPSKGKKDKDKKKNKTSFLTPAKLPPPGPLLNRVISSLSNTAIDGILKLSEVSTNKVKSYLNNNGEHTNEDKKNMVKSLNKLGKSITKSLYNTASSTASTITSRPEDNQLIKIVDLRNDKVLAVFRPPGGVSNLSLSPYDLQLVHSNIRGDSFFMWDLYKLPLEVSLIGKFTRGKTSATIRDIFWFINNNYSLNSGNDVTQTSTVDNISGNNYGFGCVTKSTGSVHWFNINYLSGSLNSNYPNILGKEKKKSNGMSQSFGNGEFSDAWILSSMDTVKLLALPDIKSNSINQLAILDKKNQIRLISPLNGKTTFKYILPYTPVGEKFVPTRNINEDNERKSEFNNSTSQINPLSRTEIETCGPYPNLYNNKNIEFSTYTSYENSDLDNFLKIYENFGQGIANETLKFDRKESTENIPEFQHKGLDLDQDVETSSETLATEI